MAVALGVFDGVHIGHQMLIRQLQLIRDSTGCKALVYTFLNNPMEFLSPRNAPPKIMTISERIKKLQRFGIDYLVLNPFDRGLASLAPQEFVEDALIKKYNIKYLVVGHDFRFGHMARGDTALLHKLSQKHGFELVIIPPLSLGERVISSSFIRKLIQSEGHMKKVSMVMGSHYTINGRVIYGYGRGKGLGFPTANLEFDVRKVIPKYGIYFTRVGVDGTSYWGMTNVGINPTFNNKGLFIETHVLNYDGNLYGTKFKIEFLKRIRDEIRFTNVEDLKEQITKDIKWAKNYVYKLQ
ncbi:MAG TPA: bifunctional riboflavin kinase/FAD synthetase [Clostridia bacterium]|nr:bifunctional riboflavin kinase/FAD synthetase [Clostridia bacterium]